MAAFCLKGKESLLNFPHIVSVIPRPLSAMPRDIRAAAVDLRDVDSKRMSRSSSTWLPSSEERKKSGDEVARMEDSKEGKDIWDELGDLTDFTRTLALFFLEFYQLDESEKIEKQLETTIIK